VTIAIAPPAQLPGLPWLAAMGLKDGRATAYLCQDASCQAPTADPVELERQVQLASQPRLIIG